MAELYVNARFITQPQTGVQRFATQLSLELVKLRPDIVFLVPDRARATTELDEMPLIRIGRHGGHLWEQLDLPRFLKRHGSPLLLNLGSTGPVRYRNQISTHHDITYVKHPKSFSLRFRLLYWLLIPRTLRHSRRLITVSEFSKSEIATHFGIEPALFTVVHNAADPRFAPPKPDVPRNRGHYMLAVSSPNEHKNVRRLLEAFELVAPSHPDLELLVVGSQASVFAKQDYSGAGQRVRFLGRVDEDSLVALYQGADGFIFPSLYEGFGIPALEAQQCGCPVVASNTGALLEVLQDSALFVDPYDVAGLAAAMASVVDDQGLRARLSIAGLANALRFSWSASAAIVSALVDAVASNRGSDR